MKCVFVYYSYSGVTKEVVHDLQKAVSGTLIEVTPDKPYNTLTAYSLGCKRAYAEEADPVSPSSIDLASYDHVIVAAPVWMGKSAPPINGAIQGFKNGEGKTASVVCTARKGAGQTLEVMRAALERHGLKVTSELSLVSADLGTKTKVEEFAATLMQKSE